MSREQFLREIARIFQVAWTQKIIKMVLRAAWVGGAVYLFCWGVNRLWGWLPSQSAWFWLAGLAAAGILATAFIQRAPSRGFVWRLDRGYRLQEQVYTTYEAIQQESREKRHQPAVDELLKSDQLMRLPVIRRELVDRGWRVKGEFESTVIVLILLLIVYLLSVEDIGRIPLDQGSGVLPSMGKDPTAAEVLTENIPGGVSGNQPANLQTEELGSDSNFICQGNWDAAAEVFVSLGNVLGQQSATHEIGQSLQGLDFGEAAQGFGNLAEDVNDLTNESREGLANIFLDTAVNFQSINRPEISVYFQNTSAALFEGDQPAISEGLDQLVELMGLCQYCPVPASQQLANTSQQSLEVNVPGGEVTIPQNFLSVPTIIDSGSIGVTTGISASPGVEVPGFVQSLPYNLNLEDSDVVSSYFSPR